MDIVGMDSAVRLAKALPAPHNMQISAGLVIDMADEIARLRAELEALQKRNDALVDLSNHVDKLYRDAKGEAEALRVDAERYRFLRMNLIPRHVFMATGFTPPYEGTPDWIDKSVDAAIDAARGKDNG